MNSLPCPSPLSPSARFRILFWLAGIILFFIFLSLIKSILLPFVVGIFAAYFLDPAVRKLCKWKWSRSSAAGVITIGFFVFAVMLCVVLVPLIAHQFSALMHKLPDYLHGLQNKYSDDIETYLARWGSTQEDTLKDAVNNFSGTLVGWGGKMASNALQSGLALLNIISLIFITPIVAFYLLRDWDLLVLHCDQLLPRDHAQTIREQLHAIDRTLSGFIRGQTTVCLLMASYYGVALSIAGLNFGLVIGIMTGLLLFIPFVGFITGGVLAVIIAFFQFDDSGHILAVFAVYGIGMALENSLITPRLVGGKVGLHPLWIIFGMLAGAALFGFVGILISVPVTAVLGVLVRFATQRYLTSSLYKGETSLYKAE